jgi:hypothetical protein
MNEGWKCPECGRCYAPWVSTCRAVDCGVTVQGGITMNPTPIRRDEGTYWPHPDERYRTFCESDGDPTEAPSGWVDYNGHGQWTYTL